MVPGPGHHATAAGRRNSRRGGEGPYRVVAVGLGHLAARAQVGVRAGQVTVGDGGLHARQGTVGLEAGLVKIGVVHG